MNLYKITGVDYYIKIEFIISENGAKAIGKFIEIHEDYTEKIECEFICEREDIIPTIEPIKEFNK